MKCVLQFLTIKRKIIKLFDIHRIIYIFKDICFNTLRSVNIYIHHSAVKNSLPFSQKSTEQLRKIRIAFTTTANGTLRLDSTRR